MQQCLLVKRALEYVMSDQSVVCQPRQHTSAYVYTILARFVTRCGSPHQHTTAYVRIRQHTSAYVYTILARFVTRCGSLILFTCTIAPGRSSFFFFRCLKKKKTGIEFPLCILRVLLVTSPLDAYFC